MAHYLYPEAAHLRLLLHDQGGEAVKGHGKAQGWRHLLRPPGQRVRASRGDGVGDARDVAGQRGDLCACVCACACICVCVWVWVGVCVHACVRVCVCVCVCVECGCIVCMCMCLNVLMCRWVGVVGCWPLIWADLLAARQATAKRPPRKPCNQPRTDCGNHAFTTHATGNARMCCSTHAINAPAAATCHSTNVKWSSYHDSHKPGTLVRNPYGA